MGTPFPNPQDAAATKKSGAGRPGAPGAAGQGARARKPRASTAKRHQDILAMPPLQVPTKFQYVSLDLNSLTTPGPSGIKQCFRTVKSIRRIPILPKIHLRADSPEPPRKQDPPLASRKGKQPAKPPSRPEDTSQSAKQLKKHNCRYCNKKFSSPGKLAQHNLSHTGELPFCCQHCDKKFNSKFKLVRHGLIHSETRPFSCPTCHKTFHRKDHLSNHERIHNPVKSVYICEKENCKKQYTSLLSFKKHTALHSAEEGNLECKICSKMFENQADIVYHLKVHAGSRTIKNENDKKFKCSFCDRKFFTGKDVRRHLVVHTGTRDFPCQFCKQEFGRKDHLVRHVKKAHPNELWQSVTPGSSGSFVDSPAPSQTTSKKGKGEAKKSKTKAELKFPRKTEDVRNSSMKSAQLATALEQTGEVFHYDSSVDTSDIMKMSQEQTIFLPCEGLVQIKLEPLVENIKMEETISSRVMYESMPSTSKDVRPMILQPVDTESQATSLGKYQDFSSGMIYMMSPPPPYSVIPSNIEMMQREGMSYVRSEGNLSGDLVESNRDTLTLIEQPLVDSLIGEEGEHSEITSQQIMSLLDSAAESTPPHEQQTVLPTFNQAFQNTTQSPKPPQHPPK